MTVAVQDRHEDRRVKKIKVNMMTNEGTTRQATTTTTTVTVHHLETTSRLAVQDRATTAIHRLIRTQLRTRMITTHPKIRTQDRTRTIPITHQTVRTIRTTAVRIPILPTPRLAIKATRPRTIKEVVITVAEVIAEEGTTTITVHHLETTSRPAPQDRATVEMPITVEEAAAATTTKIACREAIS